MADSDSLAHLHGLHADLLALSASRLANVERLWVELEGRIADFRNLLDKQQNDDKSRQALLSAGSVLVEDVEYQINEEFKQDTIQLADLLDLDEIESAKLYLGALEGAQELDRGPITTSVIRFHEKRQFLLECLRLTIKAATNLDDDTESREIFAEVVKQILQIKDGRNETASAYWRKCVSAMGDIEKWLQQLAELAQKLSILGQTNSIDLAELLGYQRSSLVQQHESLGAVASYLIKGGYTSADDFRFLCTKLKLLDKHDIVLVHYMPALTCSITQFGSSEGSGTMEEARSLHKTIVAAKDADPWALRNFHAAALVLWLAEYSGRCVDNAIGSPVQGVDVDAEAEERSTLFMNALNDGAFHFTLSVSRDIKPSEWYDPAKLNLVAFLLHEAPSLPADSILPSGYFQDLLMEQNQIFVAAFIANMPDTLRKLKLEEDEQRRNLHSRFQPGGTTHYETHLERFLLIVSYAFQGCPEEAEEFWSDPDGNLFGFLLWASKRQSTPRVAAFCEMLRSISEGEDCARWAHKFLLDEGSTASGRSRRSTSLSWAIIFNELNFFASNINDKPAAPQAAYQSGNALTDQIAEPESAMMLECYLRLTTHICSQSSAAREWVLSHPSFRIHEVLFQLCCPSIESRLRACAYDTLSALLTHKEPEVGAGLWTALDLWVAGGFTMSSNSTKVANIRSATAWTEQAIFEIIFTGFEEPTSFVGLLQALVAPYDIELGLNDMLPFPEQLGAAYRMPGIESYVDFAVGRVFGIKSFDLSDPIQTQILRLRCLEFITTCLSSFNEDLVIIANTSNIAVDTAIDASSLAAYVRLHPFARVMEWLFNEKVLAALFATAHQDIAEVNNSAPASPLVLAVVESIKVMDLVMKLQSTYLNIVRPVIKTQATAPRAPVRNSAIASFEDAVLNDLQIIVDLGFYCGTSHEGLTIVALSLLDQLSASRKLVVFPTTGFGQLSDRSKVIDILEKDNESERVAKALVARMQLDSRELEAGPSSPGYIIKAGVLDFLKSSLDALPNRPTVAHCLLGFTSSGGSLDIVEGGLFANNSSLFHAVLRLAVEYPDSVENMFVSWLSAVKSACLDILRRLWSSPISAALTMTELRASEYLFVQATKLVVVDPSTLWDGRSVRDAEFLFPDSARAFQNFLLQRSSFLEYAASEIRSTVKDDTPTLRARIQATLFGVTSLPNGQQIPTPTIFDLFDFVELDIGSSFSLPASKFLGDLDFEICKKDNSTPSSEYDLQSVGELLRLKEKEFKKVGLFTDPTDQQQLQQEISTVLSCLLGINQRVQVAVALSETLRAWVHVMTVILESCDLESSLKMNFVLQSLQIILPKLERSFSEDTAAAVELAGLARTLIQNLDFTSSTFERGELGDFANDRVFQLFRVSLGGVHFLEAKSELREICYQICYRYLRAMAKIASKDSVLRRHSLRMVKTSGERLIEVLCDDAYAGPGTCRISALLLLDALVSLAKQENSKLMIESFTRLNFIGVLVDGIKNIPTELQESSASDVPLLLSYYDASLSLLLRMCQTKLGASHVLNAGLFQSIRESQLFSRDPDIGLEFDNPNALKRFFELMLSVLRVINCIVLSRGPQNDQTVSQARRFLKENRITIVAIFKRHAKVGGTTSEMSGDLNDLVDNFTVLMCATGFLDHEEKTGRQNPTPGLFS